MEGFTNIAASEPIGWGLSIPALNKTTLPARKANEAKESSIVAIEGAVLTSTSAPLTTEVRKGGESAGL
jgi:hypothetical protein